MTQFINKPKFHKNQFVKTIFPENSRHFSEGKIDFIKEVEIYKSYEVYNERLGEIESQLDFSEIVGYHFIYTLDNGRSFDESILLPQ